MGCCGTRLCCRNERGGGGGAYACLFRERDGGYRQSRKVEAAEDGENYVCM